MDREAERIFGRIRKRWQADLARADKTGDWSKIHAITSEEWGKGERRAEHILRSKAAKRAYDLKKQEISRLAREEARSQ